MIQGRSYANAGSVYMAGTKDRDKRNRPANGSRRFSEGLNSIIVKSLVYIWSIRYLVIASFILILTSSALSFWFNPKTAVFDMTIDRIKDYATGLDGKNFFDIASFIFMNNIRASFLMLLIGFIPFIPAIVNISNGIIIGLVMRAKVDATGNPALILALMPHGIFEIPAICIATALGLGISMRLINKRFNEKMTLKEQLILSMILFLIIVLPLLVIAAIIESVIFMMRI